MSNDFTMPRAWHIVLGKMLSVYTVSTQTEKQAIYTRTCKGYYGDNIQVVFRFDEVIWLKYTGLVSGGYTRNAKPIYEGDRLETTLPDEPIWRGQPIKKRIGVVRYESDSAGFIIEWKYSKNQHHLRLDCDIAFTSVHMGNIYENK